MLYCTLIKIKSQLLFRLKSNPNLVDYVFNKYMGVSILPEPVLIAIIEGCIREDRESQKRFYKYFYSYGFAICQRYLTVHEDTVEALNDGYLKIFGELYRFEQRQNGLESSLKAWMRRVLVNTCIDRIRKYKLKKSKMSDQEPESVMMSTAEVAVTNLNYEELLGSISKLSPAYQTVFNLFVLDGYSHDEIAKLLNISVGSSKSNLAKARINLQRLLSKDTYTKKYEPKAI